VRIVADTSIWVDFLRGNEPAEGTSLDTHLERESVLMCGPVVAELLTGTAPEHREDLWLVLGSLPWADLDRPAWRQVGEVACDLRRRGTQISLTDVAIAVAAIRANAGLWTLDRDFELIREVLPSLELHRSG
jgi:predicted nucleic acid-binding protein